MCGCTAPLSIKYELPAVILMHHRDHFFVVAAFVEKMAVTSCSQRCEQQVLHVEVLDSIANYFTDERHDLATRIAQHIRNTATFVDVHISTPFVSEFSHGTNDCGVSALRFVAQRTGFANSGEKNA